MDSETWSGYIRSYRGTLLHANTITPKCAKMAVIILHGFMSRSSRKCTYDLQTAITNTFPDVASISFDFHNHGKSKGHGHPAEISSHHDLVDDLRCIINTLANGLPYVFVGHSMGAAVGLLASTRDQEFSSGQIAPPLALVMCSPLINCFSSSTVIQTAGIFSWAGLNLRSRIPKYITNSEHLTNKLRTKFEDYEDKHAAAQGIDNSHPAVPIVSAKSLAFLQNSVNTILGSDHRRPNIPIIIIQDPDDPICNAHKAMRYAIAAGKDKISTYWIHGAIHDPLLNKRSQTIRIILRTVADCFDKITHNKLLENVREQKTHDTKVALGRMEPHMMPEHYRPG